MIISTYNNGFSIYKKPAIEDLSCNRCQGENLIKDTHNRLVCMECAMYGKISDDDFIYFYDRKVTYTNHIIRIDYELTEKQIEGSDFLESCFKNNESGFLQAVCGAGKTEMTYNVILQALKESLKVCFVLPRIEVLKQLYQRFILHFPKTIIKKLFADYKDYERAHILLSTPQQMIRFHEEFDLIIVDEMDAFPLKDNLFLERLIEKSKKPSGVILYMSATITKTIKDKIKNQKLRYHLIAERYHKKLLPIPKFIKSGYFETSIVLHKFISNHINTKKQFLMFVPTIIKAEKYNAYFSLRYNCNFITSKSTNKKEIINNFLNKKYSFLITTTLLERGVTFPNIDVIVLESNHKVYTKETLIQIAGRVGRNKDTPHGEVLFLSMFKTKEMIQAQQEIIEMNDYALL